MLQGLTRTTVALVAITSVASAQPLLDPRTSTPPQTDPRLPTREPKEPVVPRSGDALDDVSNLPGVSGERVAPLQPRLSLERPVDPETYVCGAGDAFELDFWGSQNLQLRITADLEGRVFIAKVGFIGVAGKTLAVVRTAMKSKLRAVYPGLNFDVTLISPRWFAVHVVDNVKQPGAYTRRALDRVSTVIAKEAVTIGSRRRISITHRDGTTTTADLVRYELTGDVAYNPFLLDGDVIRVPMASPVVAISGAVRRPGSYELATTKDLTELLELAGGFTSGVSRALPLQLVRRNQHQQDVVTELAFAGGETPNTALQDDDRVVVRGSDDLQRTVLIIGAVVGADPLDSATSSRRVPFVDGDTVLSLLDRTGGIKAPGDLRRSYISRPRPGQPPELLPLDLDALLVRRDFSADRPVKMDDTIVVPPRQYSVLVEGAVARSGLYNYNPTFGIPEYIALAGGRTRTARDLDDAQLIDTDGRTHAFRPGMKPAPGDAILVPERNFSRSEVAQLILAGASIIVSGIAVTIAATR